MASPISGGLIEHLARYLLVMRLKEPNKFILYLAFQSARMIFPFYPNTVAAAKRQFDPMKDEYLKY